MKQIVRRSLIFLILCLLLSVVALADASPKPTVTIAFSVPDETPFYATLLGNVEHNGPNRHRTLEYINKERQDWDNYEILRLFAAYDAPEGWYFYGRGEDCTDTKALAWTYYPPDPFRVLVYFPETETYAISPAYERYAFNSVYSADLTDAAASGTFTAEDTYSLSMDLAGLLCRILLTIAVELLVAYWFGYTSKSQIQLFIRVNVITQILLNLILYYYLRFSGVFGYVLISIPAELVVFILESLLYRKKLEHPCFYAFLANLASFLVGLALAAAVPFLF